MNENDRYTNPADAGWHTAQALTLIAIFAGAIIALVLFAMGGT